MNRHDTDVVSLVFGLVFAAFVGWWLLSRVVTVTPVGTGWFAALGLLVLGGLGVLATVGPWHHRAADEPVDARGTDPTRR